MPHAHHFLERLDRVTRDQTEFALSLYRDHEAVAYVLTHVNLPEGDARVALAVSQEREGPVVLVTRDGKFVTCLGAGMRHEHPIVPRGHIEALLAKVAELRARKELLHRELRPDEEEGDILQRIFARGSRFAREDFLIVTSFEPLLGLGPFMSMLDVGVDAMKARAAMAINAAHLVVNGVTRKALKHLDRREWAAGHLTVLAGAASRRQLDEFLVKAKEIKTSATYFCSAQGGSTFFLRSAWMAARFGKAVIPSYKAAFLAGKDWMTLLDASLCLTAIGLRHASSMGEVKRVFEGYPPVTQNPVTADEMRANVAEAMLHIMANVEENTQATLTNGRKIAVFLSRLVPEGDPRRFATEESVPDDLARSCALAFDGNMYDVRLHGFCMTALPVAARAAGEEFFYPRDLVRAWFGPWTHEESLERLKRYAAAVVKVEPTRAAATPGRNDPCSCGSGKKWKKCHGGG